MTLQQKLKQDLVEAIKTKNEEKKNAIRVIMGEFGRVDKKELSDDDVVKIIKKLIKSEKELLEKKCAETESPFLTVCTGYLPAMANEDEIVQWIKDNIDFSQYKNRMQAMGAIMKHFGSAADGNAVKKILQNID